MFSEGLVLLVMGMGIVYAFLYLLVLLMRAIALVVPRFNHLMPEAAPVVRRVAAPAATAPAADEGGLVAVAIAAAVSRQRR